MRVRALLVVGLLLIGAPAFAGPIAVDAGWYGFCFAGVNSPATAGCQNEASGIAGNPFTFTALVPVHLKVTDAFLFGDIFKVLVYPAVGDAFHVTTSVPMGPIGSGSVVNPDLAFDDPGYSHTQIWLPVGVYAVDVFTWASPYSSGGAYLEVETQLVPEPTSMLLLGVGLFGLGLYGRRRLKG